MEGDYVPKGRSVSEKEFKTLEFRRTREDEVGRCACSWSNDTQSGPMYCGKLAEVIAVVNGKGSVPVSTLYLCERCRKRLEVVVAE